MIVFYLFNYLFLTTPRISENRLSESSCMYFHIRRNQREMAQRYRVKRAEDEGGVCRYNRVLSIKYSTQRDHVLSPTTPSARRTFIYCCTVSHPPSACVCPSPSLAVRGPLASRCTYNLDVPYSCMYAYARGGARSPELPKE